MPLKSGTGCSLNETIIANCQQLYKLSNLGLIDYLERILSQDETVIELANKYKNERLGEIETEDNGVETFWSLMDYLGLINYLE